MCAALEMRIMNISSCTAIFDTAHRNLSGQLGDIQPLDLSALDNEAMSNLFLSADKLLNIAF